MTIGKNLTEMIDHKNHVISADFYFGVYKVNWTLCKKLLNIESLLIIKLTMNYFSYHLT